ncbi:MAG TPA: hypothetical protein VNA20_12750 [Frankiaceae bacterium]|nr:hypothetical protein [Frankiaceae bacterium]
MSSARRAAVLPLAMALGGVLVASAPAYAAVKATWQKPTDNATFTGYSPIDFAVALDRGSSGLTSQADGTAVHLELTVPGPNPGPFRVDTSSGTGDRDLKFSFTPGCPNHGGACASGAAPAYNGRYTATLVGGASGSRTVILQVPPAVPSGVTATATGQRRVKVSWNANREPDLTGYDVFDGDGRTVAANLPADRTSHEFDLPETGYGGEHKYFVRAHRLACANCSGAEGSAQISSGTSEPASVTLTEPTPEPTPGDDPSNGGDPGSGGGDPGTGGGDGGNGGGTGGDGGSGYEGDPGPPADGGTGGGTGGTGGTGGGTGGDDGGTTDNGYNSAPVNGGDFSSGTSKEAAVRAQQQRLAFGLTFKSFAPKLGAPKLPPLPQFAPPAPEKIPWGTYDPTLNYGEKTVIDASPIASGGGITSTFVDTLTTAFEGRKLFSSIAAALLMFLAAAHLRLWLRNAPTV